MSTILTDAKIMLRMRGSRLGAYSYAKKKERDAKHDAKHWAGVAKKIKTMKLDKAPKTRRTR